MAITRSPIDAPARKLDVIERNVELTITSPYGQVPTITFRRETLQLDAGAVDKRALGNLEDISATDFVGIVPEFAHLLADIPAALDLLSERLAAWRMKQAADAAAQDNG